MLFIFLYHGINRSHFSNSLSMLKDHFAYLKDHYPIVLPGDPLPKKTSVCLTFDDGCFDLYHFVFPLLQKLDLKALLAISPALIEEKILASKEQRLEAVKNFHEKKTSKHSAFCSWQEIMEMATSEHFTLASHGLTHQNLLSKEIDLENEIITSKKLIESRIHKPISSFVYPFGKWNPTVHEKVKKEYEYIFRIGSALNFSFHPKEKLLYRISCDALRSVKAPFQFFHRLQYQTKTFWNFFRP